MGLNKSMQAATLAILASAILSFTDNFVGLVSQEAGLWQFQLFRTLFALPILFFGLYLFKIPYKIKSLKLVSIRSFIIASGLLVYFAALGFLPVAQAGAGLFSAPIWVLLFSIIVFKNKAKSSQIVAITLGFIGVLMLLQPSTESLSFMSLFPLIAGAFYGFGMLITRYWCANESASTLTIGVFITMGLVSAVMLIILSIWPVTSKAFLWQEWKTITPTFITLTLGQALGGVISVVLITQAYKIGEPSFTAVFEYTFLIFAALWSYLLWEHTTNTLAIIGIMIILISGTSLSILSSSNKTARSLKPS